MTVLNRGAHTHNRASKYKNAQEHCHLTFRVEPAKDRLAMPSLWKRDVAVIVTTVPDLPDFWECRLAPDNRPYYVNHANQTTQWAPPWNIPYAPILAVPPVVCSTPSSAPYPTNTSTTQPLRCRHSRW